MKDFLQTSIDLLSTCHPAGEEHGRTLYTHDQIVSVSRALEARYFNYLPDAPTPEEIDEKRECMFRDYFTPKTELANV